MEMKIVMFPWFAMGHLTNFLHIANKLAQHHHRIVFLLPKSTIPKLSHFNLHPDLIHFHPITLPAVDGLPSGAETTNDIPVSKFLLLQQAFDLTQPAIESLLKQLNPEFVFFDFSHWLPAIARPLGIKLVHYCSIIPTAMAFMVRHEATAEGFRDPPEGFPSKEIRLRTWEARGLHMTNNTKELGGEVRFVDRVIRVCEECDATVFRSCWEMEGKALEFLEKRFNKPVLPVGPVLPVPPNETLDEKWVKWLDQFAPKSVVFCAFGSETRLKPDHFQELVLGLEMAGFPFLAALKSPLGGTSVEKALPGEFMERVGKRGIVYGDWIQQQLILSHPSVGCFITHCGINSTAEGLLSECQLVMLPNKGDQWVVARWIGCDLKAGVEVEAGDEDGMIGREGVAKAISSAMDEESEIGKETRENHAKWRKLLLGEGVENSYVDALVDNLHKIANPKP